MMTTLDESEGCGHGGQFCLRENTQRNYWMIIAVATQRQWCERNPGCGDRMQIIVDDHCHPSLILGEVSVGPPGVFVPLLVLPDIDSKRWAARLISILPPLIQHNISWTARVGDIPTFIFCTFTSTCSTPPIKQCRVQCSKFCLYFQPNSGNHCSLLAIIVAFSAGNNHCLLCWQ